MGSDSDSESKGSDVAGRLYECKDAGHQPVSSCEKDESAIPVCTVHIGVSGDKGVGGTLKNGTPAHLLVSEGVAAGKSDLISHLLHQITFRPHQSGLHAMALKLPLSQKMAAIGVAQAAGIPSSDRHELCHAEKRWITNLS